MLIDRHTVRRWFAFCAEELSEAQPLLTQLDAAIGDADHGANMTRGFRGAAAHLEGLDENLSPGALLIEAGNALMTKTGGAPGPLWGVAFQGMGRALGDASEVSVLEFTEAFEQGLKAITDLGAAQLGEKTLVDAVAPAIAAMRSSALAGASLLETMRAARVAAEQGARDTTPMLACKGRASYLGDRSIGHQDPGATSAAIIFAALERAVQTP
jgi:phosphoenolpyruvate---glycerone phosphotransferase subunit DhaL